MNSTIQNNKHFGYNPNPGTAKLLDFALAMAKSVPYKVSLRWVFYRLVQASLIEKTNECWKRVKYYTSEARKNFYGGWRPDTLVDSIRQCDFKGEGGYYFDIELDTIQHQDFYVQLWFEAEAMHEQFQYHTKDFRVSLVPFRGDASIPIKWEIAEKLSTISEKYGKPVKILYFGDCDIKGEQIPKSALNDIRAWCKVDFDFERVGLSIEQAQRFGLPENYDKLGQYQWEALSDEQAKGIILPALEKYIKRVSPKILNKEKSIEEQVDAFSINALAEWEGDHVNTRRYPRSEDEEPEAEGRIGRAPGRVGR